MGTKKRGVRYDADRVQLQSDFSGIFPYLMKGRNESIAYYPLRIDVENLLAYVEEHQGTPGGFSFFEACLIALIKILRARPTLNRYIIGRRLYQRRDIVLSFIARRHLADDSSETNVLLRVTQDDTLATVLGKLRGEIQSAKSGEAKDDDDLIGVFMKMPRALLRLALKLLDWWDFYFDTPKFLRSIDPLRCSVYIANLGSVGMGASYHHLFEWGTCSLFVTIGQVKPTVTVGDDGQPTVRQMVELRISLDERIADGYYDAKSLDLFTDYFQNPEKLEEI